MKKRLLKKLTKGMIEYINYLYHSNGSHGTVYVTGGRARLLMRGLYRFGGCDSLPISVFNLNENYNISREYIFSIVDTGYFYPIAMIFNPEYIVHDSDVLKDLYLEYNNNGDDNDYSYNDGIFDTIEDEYE